MHTEKRPTTEMTAAAYDVATAACGYPASTSATIDDALDSAQDPCHVGHSLGDDLAFFPVMSAVELAKISVPASSPPAKLNAILAEHGVCLVTEVLAPQECGHLEEFWQQDSLSLLDRQHGERDLETAEVLEQLRRPEGLKAWPSQWGEALGKKGSASLRAAPHGQFAWAARLQPAVKDVFAKLFAVTATDLAVGVDCTFWCPYDSPAAESNIEWLHCDQNHRTGLTWPCFQGVLYVWPSEGEHASTTVIWPGSHREVYKRLMQDKFAIKQGFKKGGQSVHLSRLLDPNTREELTAAAIANSRRVPCPAGSLLLWDSRTIHQGWAGGPRLAQPICWEPKARRERAPDAAAILRRKIFMCAAGVPSSHSSCEGRVHGLAPRQVPTILQKRGLPPMKPQLRPHSIADSQVKSWLALWESLWAGDGDPRKNADLANEAALAKLLRSEVLAAL